MKVQQGKIMSRKEFGDLLDFTGERIVSFCGGEPTLHPDFFTFLKMAKDNNRKVKILTNGLWNNEVLDNFTRFSAADFKNIWFSIHILPRNNYSATQMGNLLQTLELIKHQRVIFLVSFDCVNYDYSFVMELLRQYHVKKIVYSISVIKQTSFISQEEQLTVWGNKIYSFIKECMDIDVVVENNCGFLPRCSFDENQINYFKNCFLKMKTDPVKFHCKKISLDLGSDNSSWRCFMFKDIWNLDIKKYRDFYHLYFHVYHRTKVLDQIMPFEKCYGCRYYLNEECGGGCHYYKINDNNTFEIQKLLNLTEEDISEELIPFINAEVLINKEGFFIDDYIGKINLGKNSLMTKVINYCDGITTVGEIINKVKDEFEDHSSAKDDILSFLGKMSNYSAIIFKYPSSLESEK